MGRQLRRVPKYWEHPKDENGRYKPMFDRSFREEAEEWLSECFLWRKGEHPDQLKGYGKSCSYYWQYAGNPPKEDYYRPDWSEKEATHYQMYESTSEGTPISPVFANIEDLAHWLADTRASAFADFTATYEEWLAVCNEQTDFYLIGGKEI